MMNVKSHFGTLKLCIQSCLLRVFPKRLTHGEGLLTISYCLRTIGYCFPYCFLESFVGETRP